MCKEKFKIHHTISTRCHHIYCVISEIQILLLISLCQSSSWLLLQVIGFFLFLTIICVAALMTSCGWSRCCSQKLKSSRRAVYYKLVLEEERNVLKEILMTKAKEDLTKAVSERIQAQEWETCFDVATDVIKNFPNSQRKEAKECPNPAENQVRSAPLKLSWVTFVILTVGSQHMPTPFLLLTAPLSVAFNKSCFMLLSYRSECHIFVLD